MRCSKHFNALHTRLKAEATGLNRPGQWNCQLCNPTPQIMIDHGYVDFSDRRETVPFELMPPMTAQRILKNLVAQANATRRVSELGRALVPAGTPGTVVAMVPAGEDLEANVYSGSAGQLEATSVPVPEPPPKKVFIDAANIDLDDPAALGRDPKPRAKPKPKAKAKPRAKAKKAPKQSEGLF